MKRNKLSLILLTLLVITLISSFNLVNVNAISNINYTFERLELYDTDNISYDTVFNFDYEKEITELYNATYSFTDDTIGGYPSGWIYNEGASTEIQIEVGKENHSKTVSLNDWGSSTCYIERTFDSAQTYGTIEFWFLAEGNSANRIQDVRFGWGTLVDTTTAWRLVFDTNTFTLYHSGGTSQIGGTFEANKWYHIKFTFDCTSGGYDGNGLRGVRPYINGYKYPSYTFWYSTDSLIKMRCTTWGGTCTVDEKIHYDAFGYSWDSNYIIGNNIAPYFNTTSKTVVSKDEFAFDDNGFIYENGNYEACGWAGSDPEYTYIYDDDDSYDNTFKLFHEDLTDSVNIIKDFNITDGLINITSKVSYLEMNNIDSVFGITIYDQDDTTVLSGIRMIRRTVSIRLEYYDGSWNELQTISAITDLDRTLNLFIGYNICRLLYVDGAYDFKESFSKVNYGTGLGKIVFYSEMDDNIDDQTILIDNMGTFVNGIRLVNDYGIRTINMSVSNWNSETYKIFRINANGWFSVGLYSIDDSESLRGFYNYNGIRCINVHNHSFNFNNPFLMLTTNQSFTISSLEITGVRLTDGTNNYIPYFYYGSVNIDESYFYVDTSNRLRFTLIANDNYTEWIELRFDLLFIATENRSLSFMSNINGISQGYVHLAYWGWATTDIYFPYYTKTTTVHLPHGYVIFTLSIIIFDMDITWYDICQGYITNLKLVHAPEGKPKLISVDIANLVMIIIPLIVLIAPSLAISIKFGKKSIIPMFMVMSIICVATQMIPIWLFFLIIIGSGALLITQYKKEGD